MILRCAGRDLGGHRQRGRRCETGAAEFSAQRRARSGQRQYPASRGRSGLWDLDYFKGLNGPARAILGGWQLGGILQANSNLPFSARLAANVDLNNDGNRNSERAPGFGRNSFDIGHFVSFDFRTTKTFYFTERYHLQFIAEFFNIFNRLNISSFNGQLYNVTGVPSTGLSLTRRADFGNPRGALDPRIGVEPMISRLPRERRLPPQPCGRNGDGEIRTHDL
jgi:hypothetical protein